MNIQRKNSSSVWTFGLFVAALTICFDTRAQSFSLDWYGIADAGGESAGGSYSLVSTLGQPDAGASQGGNYSLSGGFLSGLIPESTSAPTLVVEFSQGSALISWSPAPNFVLEQTTTLTSPSWSAAPVGNPVTISPGSVSTFYRLRKP